MAEPATAGAVALPEAAAVYWRRPLDAAALRRSGRIWTAWTVAHVVPFLGTAVLLMLLQPLAFAVAAIALAHAWIIPGLYAQRGANVVRPKPCADAVADRRALGLLGDLVGHEARELLAETGLALERGGLGVWLVGEAGALLVPWHGRRVHCFCVRATGHAELPPADRIAHLLLALREDERGFGTVANQAFAGAPWRISRRLEPRQRPAVERAVALAAGAR
jgi:hypothetical protein